MLVMKKNCIYSMITHPYILQIEITFNKQYNIDISKRIIVTIINKPRQHKIRSPIFFSKEKYIIFISYF